jgi:hypothetical protein
MIQRLSFFFFVAVAPILAKADAPDVSKILSIVPAEAAGFVIVPSIDQLDADLQQAIARAELQDMVAPGMVSVSGLLRQYLGLSEGLDTKGALALVFMPVAGPEAMQMTFVLPATDPQGLLKAAGAQAGEGGLWSVAIMGTPYQAALGEGRVVLASAGDMAKTVAAPKTSIATRLADTDQAAMKAQDLLIWVDGEKMIQQFKPQIDGFMAMMMMMQGGGNPAAMAQAENARKEIQILLDGLRSVLIGASLDTQGLGLRFYATSRPGTEFASRMKLTRTTAESLLTGLPSQKFMIAGGMVVSPETGKKMMDQVDPYIDMLSNSASEANKPHITTLKQLAREWANMSGGGRVSVGRLPAGPDGVLGAALLMDVTDAAKCQELLGKVVAEVKQLDPGADADAKHLLEALSFETGKETLGGVPVGHLKLDLGKFEDMEEEEVEDVQKIIGRDGFLLRLTAANDKTLAVSLGGGSAFMTQLIEQVRGKAAPLDKDPGVQRVAARVPKDRSAVAYVSVDQIIACIRDGQKACEEEQLPVEMPVIDAPLLLTSTGSEAWSQSDVFVPTELIVATKTFIMAMTGGDAPGGAPPAAPPAPAGGN